MFYFQFAAFFWWPLILSGMIILYYFAFFEYSNTTQSWKAILDPLRAISLAIFKSEYMLRVVWRCAITAHFCEAMYAVNVCIDIGCLKLGSWFVQTLLLGYPSLRLLLKRKSLGVHKNDVETSNAPDSTNDGSTQTKGSKKED